MTLDLRSACWRRWYLRRRPGKLYKRRSEPAADESKPLVSNLLPREDEDAGTDCLFLGPSFLRRATSRELACRLWKTSRILCRSGRDDRGETGTLAAQTICEQASRARTSDVRGTDGGMGGEKATGRGWWDGWGREGTRSRSPPQQTK